jgi:hypothetical protein
MKSRAPDRSSRSGPDPLDEAIAELQGVIDKDSDMGPLGDDLDMEDGDAAAAGTPAADATCRSLSCPFRFSSMSSSAPRKCRFRT